MNSLAVLVRESPVKEINPATLALYDISIASPLDEEPNMALIIGLSTTGAIILIVAVLIFLYIDPFGWEVFSTKRFRARYKELSEPFVTKEIRKYKEQEIESLKPFAFSAQNQRSKVIRLFT